MLETIITRRRRLGDGTKSPFPLHAIVRPDMPQERLKVSLRDIRRNRIQTRIARHGIWLPTSICFRNSTHVRRLPRQRPSPPKRGGTTLALVRPPGVCSQQHSNTPPYIPSVNGVPPLPETSQTAYLSELPEWRGGPPTGQTVSTH